MIGNHNPKELAKQFSQAKPFPHIIIDNFLEEQALINVAQAIVQEDFQLKESDLFTFYQTNDLVSTNNPKLKAFYDYMKSDEAIDFFKTLTQLDLTPQKIDLQGSIYADTNFLLCHDDKLDNRKLAFILYFNDMAEHEGGALTLFDQQDGKPTTVAKRILPKQNRLICFGVSDLSFHEVEEVLVDKQRIAIGGWYH